MLQPCPEATISTGPTISPCGKKAERWVLAATILGSSMAFIDGTVVNVALPALQNELHVGVADVQWVVEAYLLLLSALLLIGGALGDHYGRRRIFLIGIAIFALASAWCGLALGIWQLIAARALQGLGAALLVPGSLAIISSSFREQDRGRAIGTWSGFSAITAAIGPALGGWIIEHLSWRAVFFINVPLALVVIAISLRHVPETSNPAKTPLDLLGAVLVAAGLGALVYGLIESARPGVAQSTAMIALVLAALLLTAFVVWEARNQAPMVPLELFRSPAFTGANLVTLFLYGALGATFFFLPLNLIQVQHYTPTAAGAALLPLILIISLLSRWAGGLVARFGPRLPLVIGPLIAAAGFALFARPSIGGSYWSAFFPAVAVLGIGMAISVAPLTTTVMNAVPQDRAGVASGINNAVARAAGLLAIAIFGAVMLHTFQQHLAPRVASLHLPPTAGQAIEDQQAKLAGAEIPSDLIAETRDQLRAAIDQSFVAGFRVIAVMGAGLALASAITALFMIAPRVQENRED
ncbi:MAG TPA: MFS transporter [Chthoniobacterales bacterium]|nr:MFS transporter [Chthoniobacterales bacterium]